MNKIAHRQRSTKDLFGLRLKQPLTKESVEAAAAINGDAYDFEIDNSFPPTPTLTIAGWKSTPNGVSAKFSQEGVFIGLQCWCLETEETTSTVMPRALHMKAFETLAFLLEEDDRVPVQSQSAHLRVFGTISGQESPGGHHYVYQTEMEAVFYDETIRSIKQGELDDQVPGHREIMLWLVKTLAGDVADHEELDNAVCNVYDREIAEKFNMNLGGFDLMLAYPPLYDNTVPEPGNQFVAAVLEALVPA